MASLTINFLANTSGDHYVGYREIHMSPPNTYTVITVPVVSPGPQSAEIEITGSLYCGELHYQGYIIAACQSQTDSNSDGIPDAAITWSQVVPVVEDPNKDYTITCDNSWLESVELANGGTAYGGVNGNPGAPITVVIDPPTAPGGVQATATANLGNGVLTDIFYFGDGGAYGAGNYNTTQVGIGLVRGDSGQAATTGTGATVDVTFDGSGFVTNVVLNTGGSGYTARDAGYFGPYYLTLNLTDLIDSASPTAPGELYIEFYADNDPDLGNGYADGISRSSFTITNPGQGYQVVPSISFTPVTEGSPASLSQVLLGGCGTLDLEDYASNGVAIPIMESAPQPWWIEPSVGDTLRMCVNETNILTLPSTVIGTGNAYAGQYVVTEEGNCSCRGCNNLQVDTTAATEGYIVFAANMCWDLGAYWGSRLTVRKIYYNNTYTDVCIIPETFTVLESTLDIPASITTTGTCTEYL